jgi:sigma-B regulation protein RsbU (phosphoserine phosphatase)
MSADVVRVELGEAPLDALTELKNLRRLASDLKNVVLPLGLALSAEKSFNRLVERILIEAQAVCNADAGSFYLRTPDDHLKFAIMRTDSLKIALGGTTGCENPHPPLPLYDEAGKPNERNVATVVALHGATVNIPDIYHAQGFDFSGARAADQRNNYRTTSCLAVPLKNNEDEVIGVLQLLNAQDPETGKVVPFNSYSQQVVESLASQAAVALNNHLLLDRQKKFLQIQADLEIGRTTQANFLPETLPQLPSWEIGAYFAPAREVSGDFYDVFKLSEGYVALVVADVCNKGIGAALFMALFRSLFRAFSQQTLTRDLIGLAGDSSASSPRMIGPQLASLLVDLNALSAVGLTNNYVAAIHASAYMFATVFFAVLDVNTGLLTYVNAGHDAPAVIGPEGVKARLAPTGPVVGMTPNAPYNIKKVMLEPGEMLYVYTDGVTDSRAPDGAFFTEKRMLGLLNEPAATAAGLVERMQSALRDHIASADPFDDITMLCVRRAPEA